MVRPCKQLFEYYVSFVNAPHSFDPVHVDQSLLSLVHRQDGNMPWRSVFRNSWQHASLHASDADTISLNPVTH